MLKIIFSFLICQSIHAHDLDQILDKLEEKLRSDEQMEMNMPPQKSFKEPHYHTKSQTFSPTKSDIIIQKINQDIKNLQTQVGSLEKDIERVFQETLAKARNQNRIQITTAIQAEGTHQFSSLTVKLNSQEIYASDTQTGFWVPDDHLPVFWGTLPPGTHHVAITARIHRVAKSTHPTRGERFIQKSFQIHIPQGPYQKEWAITLQPDFETSSADEAVLTEKDIS